MDLDLFIGKRIRHRRLLLNLKQGQLAEACGVQFQQIQKYECGLNRISAINLHRIAIKLEVSISYFFEGISENDSDTIPLSTRTM
jgi:transcriptional regulator with XRE-family HTH domain